MSTPKTKSIPTAPGIHRVALLEPATDTAGRMWPAGTEISASVVLIDAHTPGTGVAARPKPLPTVRSRKSKSMTRETPATTTQGV